jgi:tellurite methyltransferase
MINPINLIREFNDFLIKQNIKKVLDLGCGNGRVSLRFAKNKISVTGVDKQPLDIKQENFNFLCQDVKEFEFKEKFDLIIASLILHFLDKEKAFELIKKMQKNTNEKGYNFFICLSNKDDSANKRPNNFFPTISELKELYSDWELIKEVQDYTDYEKHDNLPKHKHNLIFLIFRKN